MHAIKYLFESLPMYQRVGAAAYKADLKNAYALDEYFDYPHKKFISVHIAGTNGKGSVSHMLASVFQAAGYKTGLYTSPHLIDFRERIKINGHVISKAFVIEFTRNNLEIFKKTEASFFEMTVFMAYDYFAKNEVDVAIIEVGLGGRLDTTNTLNPELSVITNIGLDHTQFLGKNLKSIAAEKAGIIKNNVPVVIGRTQPETEPVFNRAARERESSIYFADQLIKSDYTLQNLDHTVKYHFAKSNLPGIEDIDTDLKGAYQKENIITTLTALNILNKTAFSINAEAIRKGLRDVVSNTRLLGRWQEIRYNPLVVCDTAHNADGFQKIISQIRNTAYQNLFMILGFVNDKPIERIISQLVPDAYFILVEPGIPRAMKNKELIPIFEKYKLPFSTCKSISGAFNYAIERSTTNDLIFIGGSTFLVADFLVSQA